MNWVCKEWISFYRLMSQQTSGYEWLLRNIIFRRYLILEAYTGSYQCIWIWFSVSEKNLNFFSGQVAGPWTPWRRTRQCSSFPALQRITTPRHFSRLLLEIIEASSYWKRDVYNSLWIESVKNEFLFTDWPNRPLDTSGCLEI